MYVKFLILYRNHNIVRVVQKYIKNYKVI
jgi:hypothetical protein